MCGPMKIPKLTTAPGNRTRDLKIARLTLYLKTTDTMEINEEQQLYICISLYLNQLNIQNSIHSAFVQSELIMYTLYNIH